MLEVKILKSEEFDNLPHSVTKGSDVTQYLGFADPETGKAYVRHTAIPELNQYLVNHEVEHLISSPHTHRDENGLCCKGFGDLFRTIGNFSWNPGGIFSRNNSPGGNLFGGSQQQQQTSPQAAQMQTAPQGARVSNFQVGSRPESAGGALGNFGSNNGTASSRVPETAGGTVIGRLGGAVNTGLNSVDPNDERAKGNYAGRFNF